MAVKLPPQVESLFNEALERGASDVFLLPGEPPTMRVNGLIERTDADPLSAEELRSIAAAMIGEEDLEKIGREVGEITRWCGVMGVVNATLSVARAHGDYTIVFGLNPPVIVDVKRAQIPEAMLEAACSGAGLVVFSGLAGSGKTTSLLSVVDYVNTQIPCHICTVENPIHVHITAKKALVQQREVGVDVPNCLSGIRAAMKQDLDVLCVGEITSVEELEACITAAETGHLVVTQLHAPTPEAAIQRIIDVFPDDLREVSRKALASVLKGVSAQRLLAAKEGGRVPAYGVLIPDDEMRLAIAEGRDFMCRRGPMPEGSRTMEDDIKNLLRRGIISEEVAKDALHTTSQVGV